MEKKKIINNILICIILLAIGSVVGLLFYKQGTMYNHGYDSDLHDYIEQMEGNDTNALFPYPVLFWASGFVNIVVGNPEFAMALTLACSVVISIIIVYEKQKKIIKDKYLVLFTSTALMFVSMLFLSKFKSFGIPHYYLGVWTPNPWHNGTYLAARPFAILSFYYWVNILKENEEYTTEIKNNISASIWLLLSTMTKPSYTLVHLISVVLYVLGSFIRKKRFDIKKVVRLFFVAFPTIVALLYQYIVVYINGSMVYSGEQGIGIDFLKVWGIYTDNYIFAIILGISFPIVVLLFSFNELKKIEYRLSWIIYLVGLFTSSFFYEKGEKMVDFNFGWGYMFGMLIVFISSTAVLLEKTNVAVLTKKEYRSKKQIIKLGAMWMFFGAHILCGVAYFVILLSGFGYTI